MQYCRGSCHHVASLLRTLPTLPRTLSARAVGRSVCSLLAGNFEEYEADRVSRMGDAIAPIKYATLA